jgi:hypothetical protein
MCYIAIEVCLPKNSNGILRFEVLTLVPVKSTLFWDQIQGTQEV